MVIQSIRFLKSKWKDKKAQILWLRQNGYIHDYKGRNPQYTNYDSYRQLDPSAFMPGSFRTHKTLQGILYIYGELRT